MKKVLIIEDTPLDAKMVKEYLDSEGGLDVTVATTGKEGFDKAKAINPDLILLDLMLPDIDGFEVCQQIKSDASKAKIMVLMVTALNELGDIERAVKAGTDDFLSKPINKIELIKRVENMLRLKDTTDELERLRQYIRSMDKQPES